MKFRVLLLSGLAVLASAPAWSASDATNDQAVANQAVAGAVSPVAASQTAGLIGGAVGGAVGGSIGGGGVGGAPGGGFSPGGGATPGPTSHGPADSNHQLGALNTRMMGKAGQANAPKMGVWAQGTYVDIEKSEVALQMEGSVYNLVGGVDYKFNDRGVVGLALGYESIDIDTTFNRGTYEGTGFTVAPYIGYAITPNWSVDASVGYTWLEYDVSRTNNAVRGSFDASRWFGAANLTGNYAYNRWRLQPKVGVLYLEEQQDSYRETGTSTARVAEQTITLGRLSAGLKAGYAFNNFMPYAKLIGEYDFEKPDSVLKSNGRRSSVDDGGLVYGVGVDFYRGNFSGSLEGSYNSGLREDLDVYSLTARARVQF